MKIYQLNLFEPVKVFGPLLRLINAYLALNKIFSAEKPDILQHQTGVDYLSAVSGYVAKKRHIPSIIKFAGDFVWERIAPTKDIAYEKIFKSSIYAIMLTALQRWTLSNYTFIWAMSKYQQDILVKYHRVSESKIFYLPNFIDFKSLAIKTEYSNRTESVKLLCVSRFAKWKKLENLLLAVSKIDKSKYSLEIIGGEDNFYGEKLEIMISKLGLNNNVALRGAVSPVEMKQEYKKNDIFVFPTIHEPLGLVVVEAMAVGLPVVASRTGGIPEMIVDGETGYLVESNNIDELTEKIENLIGNPVLRKKYGEFGKSVINKYSLEENIVRFIDLYKTIKKN